MRRLIGGVAAALVLAGSLLALFGRGLFGSVESNVADRPVHRERPLEAPASRPATHEGTGRGMAALDEAARRGKYLFAFFWKDDDQPTQAMRQVFDETMKELADRADTVVVRVDDPAERPLVAKFGLDRAPMPLVLAVAPNGAVMGGFPREVTAKELREAFGSPCAEQCMKALQDGKLVFLCVQNASTRSHSEALAGVRQFQSDARYQSATEVVLLDPADSREAPFLKDLQIDPKTSVAVTAFLAPPGVIIAQFEGATDKEALVAALQRAASNPCGGGACGPGGCGPRR